MEGNIANTRFFGRKSSAIVLSVNCPYSTHYYCNPAAGPTTTQSRQLWQYVTVDSIIQWNIDLKKK